jgi:sarcosine dehydrogenase
MSREIMENICDYDFSNENFPPNSAAIVSIKDRHGKSYQVRVLRVSFVGELGYELHIPKESCEKIHKILMRVGGAKGLKNAGYRSLYSLSSEKGLKISYILKDKIFNSIFF